MEKPTYFDEEWDTQLAEMDGWINALEWVIEDQESDFSMTEDEFWNRFIEEVRKSKSASREQILQHIREALEAPVPFFEQLLKNKK